MKIKIALAVFALATIIAAGYLVANRNSKEQVASKPEPVAVVKSASATEAEPVAAQQNITSAPASPTTAPAQTTVAIQPALPADTVPADQTLKINGYTVQDPVARVALSFVGSDLDADAYWFGAINNPDLPPEERKDLIEDLNEDGLINPRLAAPEDLPIIANRIRLIEQVAPMAMDQTDADAFAEAYNDLVNLYNGLPAN